MTGHARGPRSADRWLEMDLTWFDPDTAFGPQIDLLLERVSPMLESVRSRRGIFFNLGWLVDVVTEWTGDADQLIPTRSRRTAAWAACAYTRLREFVTEFHDAASARGMPDVVAGILFVNWAHVVWPPELKIYDFESDWYDRHPEIYEPPKSFIGMPDLHPVKRLHADDYRYASFPDGIAEGTSFGALFGAQWARLAEFTGFQAVLLRDGFCGPMIYTRNGPFGTSAPDDPALVAAFSDGVRQLFREVKQAAPDTLLFGYSSAISPVADWRVGCVDFEALVADGFIDGWIEQTWGGAWQDWWHQLWKGWTFQTANLLTRQAMIQRANEQRDRPCALFHLVETWDGWEHWDTLHQVPGKLTWGAWAFAHASALTPDGPRPSDGAYVSWLNNGHMDLLSVADVEFVTTLLDRTERSAAALEDVFGPALVYDRATMAKLAGDHPGDNIGEWIDDQAGLLMKWATPVLTATRPEWLPAIDRARQLIAQPPALEGSGDRERLLGSDNVLLTGRADAIDATIAARAGVTATGRRVGADFWVCTGDRDDVPPFDRPYLPEHSVVTADASAAVLSRTADTPLLVSRDGWAWWQPTDWSEPFNQFVPKYQVGSTYPAFRVAVLLAETAAAAGRSHIADVSRPQPVAFHAWRSGGSVHVLLGNLETGEFGDSRVPRNVDVRLSRRELGLPDEPLTLTLIDGSGPASVALERVDAVMSAARITLEPESAAVYVVGTGESAIATG